jgi:diaminohydroxyphosphoribosylaminopyrimidine deaminase / 5-amino-6-(5-phosphoribosylamino)uracil reductase
MINSSSDDHGWLAQAVELSWLCPPVETAYAVGAIIVDEDGKELSRGYSRDDSPVLHAEESALAKLIGQSVDLSGATIYTSMEPCSSRRSGPRTCTELILAAGLHRVVIGLLEPPVFVDCVGLNALRANDIEVVRIADFDDEIRAVNGRVLSKSGSSPKEAARC